MSLLHSLNNIWALCQMKITHQGLLKRVAEDLNQPQKIKDLTPAYMARVVWVYRRCQVWDLVAESLLPLLRGSSAEFACGDFARLAQALPEERQTLKRVAENLKLTRPGSVQVTSRLKAIDLGSSRDFSLKSGHVPTWNYTIP